MPAKQSAVRVSAEEYISKVSSVRGRCPLCNLPNDLKEEVAKLREWKIGPLRIARFLNANGYDAITMQTVKSCIYVHNG